MKIHLGDMTIYQDGKKLTIDRKYYLKLALYNIEKEHNFSGSYMWTQNKKMEDVGSDAMTFLTT